ncbi:hypothetical protein RJT34_09237 [Clitoria ternatea]|uniref:Exostosin GT47 domain-containing protein n=1 Tax=Clitoria ternatea TaxID=43366 RepID=A0AAN9K797_CLITE
MDIPRRYLFAAIFSLFLFSFVVIFVVLLPGQLLEFATFAVFKPRHSVPLDRLRTKLSGENQLLAVGNSGGIRRDKFRTATTRKLGGKVEERLAGARASMREAATESEEDERRNVTTAHDGGSDDDDDHFVPSGAVYRNPRLFHRSYELMEKIFKVYVYPDGDLPITHDGPCKSIYSIEGRFLHEMEHSAGRFRTNNPNVAHVFFLPFSVTWMVKYFYIPDSHNLTPLKKYVSDYIRVISTRHPFWNRTRGADHFMLSCHDWSPYASQGNPFLYNTSIRVLCNANTSEGFKPRKDVSLPEIYLYGGEVSPKLLSPPSNNTPRYYLAFFAGGEHGSIRSNLIHHWKNHDNEIRVYEYLPKELDYYSLMLNSKFCLCPSGHEVASPRIVEAIYAECVPVILSEYYVLPFSDVLQWEAFSVQVDVSDIPRLKEILSAIPEEKYQKLKEGVRAVRRHFTLNQPTKRYDVFHMILHSVWLRRLNIELI